MSDAALVDEPVAVAVAAAAARQQPAEDAVARDRARPTPTVRCGRSGAISPARASTAAERASSPARRAMALRSANLEA